MEEVKGKPPLAILGTASSVTEAPFESEDVEIWGMSSLTEDDRCKRLDKAFEFHPKRYWGIPDVLGRLKRFKGDVVMQDHYDEIPNSVAYPVDEIRERFKIDAMGRNLFVTNSITWMLLLAIHEGYKDVSLFGVHMKHDTEYSYQQPSCSWALGIIHGLILSGEMCSLYIAEESDLLKARYEYGFDEPSELMQWIQDYAKRLQLGVKEAERKAEESKLIRAETMGGAEAAKAIFDHMMGYR